MQESQGPMTQAPREEPITSKIRDAEQMQVGQLQSLHSIMNDIEDGLFGSQPRGVSGTLAEKADVQPGILPLIYDTQEDVRQSLADLESRLVNLRNRVTTG